MFTTNMLYPQQEIDYRRNLEIMVGNIVNSRQNIALTPPVRIRPEQSDSENVDLVFVLNRIFEVAYQATKGEI